MKTLLTAHCIPVLADMRVALAGGEHVFAAKIR
jgi:hypothetical protein